MSAAPALGPWRAAWRARPARERALVVGALGLLLGLGLLRGLLLPAWSLLQAAPAQRAALEADALAMRPLLDDLRRLEALPPLAAAEAEGALRSATTRLLGPGSRLQAQGPRWVVELREVDGAALGPWLAACRRDARARPVELRLERQPDGRYQGRAVLALGEPA